VLFAVISCPSIRPYVTSRFGIQTAQIGSQERRRTITERLQFYDPKDLYEIPMGSPTTGAPNAEGVGKDCVFDPSRSLLPPKMCVHPPRWSTFTTVCSRMNTRCHQQHRWYRSHGSRNWLITVTAQLRESLLMTRTANFSVRCIWHGTSHACCAIFEPTAMMRVQNYAGNWIKRGSC